MTGLSDENQRLIETVRESLPLRHAVSLGITQEHADEAHRRKEASHDALDAIAAKLARLEMLERGAADFLDVAERVRGGDPSLSPEAWYAERDYMRALLAAREEETA